MKVCTAQESDHEAVAQLFLRTHQFSPGQLRLQPEHESQVLVAKSESRLIGLALVSYVDDGLHCYGIVHVFQVDEPATDNAHDTSHALVDACRDWFRHRGVTLVYTTPAVCVAEYEVLQPAGTRDLVLDAASGQIRGEGGGLQGQSFDHAVRQRWS
jgi:hypothetical protein